MHPGADELCDGLDTDCDPTTEHPDGELDQDGDGVRTCAEDCDDSDDTAFPGNTEVCDGVDNDCDGAANVGGGTEVDEDGDSAWSCEDCDDADASVHPGADELCDGLDTDCDAATDHPDGEVDGDGDSAWSCEDCDDADASVHPGADELCDGLDTDCDAATEHPDGEFDVDLDGAWSCDDCDDTDDEMFPGNPEVCDGKDNDCLLGINFDTYGEADADADGQRTCEGDCDDNDGSNFDGNAEVCDGQDNDCDGSANFDGGFELDDDTDGSWSCDDCDDTDGAILPGATESCDSIDSDCDDSIVDEFDDLDGDLIPDCVDPDADGDGDEGNLGDDCDDLDASIYDGAPEVIGDGIDQDCNGFDTIECFRDLDLDGAGTSDIILATDADCDDPGESTADDDCDDGDDEMFPGNSELCDGKDNDCDGSANYDGDAEVDLDGDGSWSCDDCDDYDGDRFPGAAEVCDTIDSDCDGSLVDEFADLDLDLDPDCTDPDADGDGEEAATDCDDLNALIYPGAPEVVGDGIDQDCNDFDTIECFQDLDLDGAGAADTVLATDGDCDDLGESLTNDDCNDLDDEMFPDHPEVCDGKDNNCNGLLDYENGEVDDDSDGVLSCLDCDDADPANYQGNIEACDGQDNDCDSSTWADGLFGEEDLDVDGHLNCNDCDDADDTSFPGATELCDGLDNDCNTFADYDAAGEVNVDGDGYLSCEDCDDADPDNYPGNAEVCDAGDNDCDASVDEGFDADGDGVTACGPDGIEDNADDDCDDSDINNYPGNAEACDGQDNDCNGLADMAPAGEAVIEYEMTHSSEDGGPDFDPYYSGFWANLSMSHDATTTYDITYYVPDFTFEYYGELLTMLNISVDGYLQVNVAEGTNPNAGWLPDAAGPNSVIALWWEDLDPETGGPMRWGSFGSGDNEVVAVGWDAPHRTNNPSGPLGAPMSGEIHLHENTGDIIFHFILAETDPDPWPETVGIENQDGTLGSAWYNQTTTHESETGTALRFSPYDAGEIDYDNDTYLACADCDDTDDQITGPCTE